MTGGHIERITLEDADMRVALLSLGAVTQGWWLNDQPLILGYDDPQAYLTDPYYMGAVVGRVANRIGGARFTLDGIRYDLNANDGTNTLHGGANGLSRQTWTITQLSPGAAVLSLQSPDGDNGFPGSVRFEIQITLSAPRLTYEMSAYPDRPTPISLAQHNYYAPGSARAAAECQLMLCSDRVLELDDHRVPTGKLAEAARYGFDVRGGKPDEMLDHFFPFDHDRAGDRPVAELTSPDGLRLRVFSDQPGAQVYAGAHLGPPFSKGAGLCIEPSGYPNAVNIPSFPPVIATPDKPYKQTLILDVSGGRA